MHKYNYESEGDWIVRLTDRAGKHELLYYLCGLVINSTDANIVSVELSWSKTKTDAITFIEEKAKEVINSVIPHKDKKYSLVRKV